MILHSSTKSGRIAEFFACGVIEELGWQTSLCQQDGVDLIAFNQNEFIRVQVKGSRIRKEPNKNTGLQFMCGIGGNKRMPNSQDFDIACMVSIDHRKCWFLHVCDVQRKTIRRPKSFFENADLEFESWERSLDIFRENRSNEKY